MANAAKLGWAGPEAGQEQGRTWGGPEKVQGKSKAGAGAGQ